jgi:hypothetical protein
MLIPIYAFSLALCFNASPHAVHRALAHFQHAVLHSELMHVSWACALMATSHITFLSSLRGLFGRCALAATGLDLTI